MPRTKGALDRTNPEYIKQLEDKKVAVREKADDEIAKLDAQIKAAKEKRYAKLAEKLAKSGKTDKEIEDFIAGNK